MPAVAMSAASDKLIVGRISGVYGVKGWIKVHSETDPREGIARYNPWFLKRGGHGKGEWREVHVEECRRHAKTIIAKLDGVDDRDQAQCLAGDLIGISPDQLQVLAENEFYWRDLIGLRVFNREGIELGTVRRLMETGANDVLVVGPDKGGREHLVPWTPGNAILRVDTALGRIEVDWDADF